MNGNAVEGQVDYVHRFDVVVQVLIKMKTEIAPGPSDVSLELIVARRELGIQVMAEV